MKLKGELKSLFYIVAVFLACFYLPVGTLRFDNALREALELVKWYAREHVLLCLVPAFFIAGAISTFISRNSVMKYLGAGANKIIAYGVASVSGSILAVCSCTVLPLFGGIYKMGAGLGPATAFLYSGPAINVIAMILTMRVLGLEIGIARIIGAVSFSIVIGLLMHLIFRKGEIKRIEAQRNEPVPEGGRPLYRTAIFFASMIAILVFANWAPADAGFWMSVYNVKWILVSFFAVLLGFIIATSFDKGEAGEWVSSTWDFAKQILPLLLIGVLMSGFLLGRPGHDGIIPSQWVVYLVGGNSLLSNFTASFAGAFMYFATLTEIPILQGLMGSGMGKGPALALLLAGPALSLPSMLVINKIMGTARTVVYITLVIVMSTITGMIFGAFF